MPRQHESRYDDLHRNHSPLTEEISNMNLQDNANTSSGGGPR